MSAQVITVSTSLGNAEARREHPTEAWEIGYPWKDARFHGSAKSVLRLMERTITAYEKSEDTGAVLQLPDA